MVNGASTTIPNYLSASISDPVHGPCSLRASLQSEPTAVTIIKLIGGGSRTGVFTEKEILEELPSY